MTININNKPRNIPENSSIVELLEVLKLSEKGIAVAVNNTVVSKPKWNTTTLLQTDQITIIQATQGG